MLSKEAQNNMILKVGKCIRKISIEGNDIIKQIAKNDK